MAGGQEQTNASGEAEEDQPPHHLVFLRVILALSIGALGGLIFHWLTMPLPWMLGPMIFNMAAAVIGLPVLPPIRLRPYVVVVIGVMLGSGFTPEIVDHAAAWALSFLFLALYLAISGVLVIPYYRRVGGVDPVTAYFSGMPGGLNEMLLIGRDAGGDEKTIALAHASRIVLVVFGIAIWFRLIAGYELGDRSQFGVPFAAIPMGELAILALAGLAGYFVGKLLRLPAPTLIGPMLVSAFVHLAGFTDSPPPSELVVVAQLFLGTIIGCRFVGSRPREIGHAVLLAVGATMIMLGVSLFFAVAFHGLFAQPMEQVLLAYAPGGLAEMSLISLAMNADVAYIASHHMVRITLVILLAPLVFSLIGKPAGGAESDRQR